MSIDRRIARLERTNRLLIAVLCAAALLTVGSAAVQRDNVPEVIRTKRLAIVDEEGRVRIGMTANNKGPAIILLNESQKAIANFGAESGRTSITISDNAGVIRGGLAALPDRTMLVLSDRRGAVALQMQATDQGPTIDAIAPDGTRTSVSP